MNLKESIKEVKKSVVRILVFRTQGQIDAATGFYIGKNLFLTCSHVVFASDGREFETQLCALKDKKDEVRTLFQQRVSKIEIVTDEGISLGEAKLEDFSLEHDAATLRLENQHTLPAIKRSSPTLILEIGEEVAFCGFPLAPFYTDKRTYPFMLNEGIIAGFPNQEVGGFPRYRHIQINAVSVGGFSGSPLFLKDSGIIIGIINGNRSEVVPATKFIPPNTLESKLQQIPVGIAYATELSALPIL